MGTGPHPTKLKQTSTASKATATLQPKAAPAPPLASPAISTTRWIIGLLALVAIFDLGVWGWMRSRVEEPPVPPPAELVLGTFEFNRLNPRDGRTYQGQFDLKLRLADSLDAIALDRMNKQQRQLQRAVETVLERMRAVDFTDPHLVRLKSRLLDRLNEALGSEVIDELIVDDFSLDRLDRPAASGPAHSQPAKSASSDE